MKHITILLLLILSSCSVYTEITYRQNRKEKYIREDGFMLSCSRDVNRFIFSTFTPASWNESMYYGYFAGNSFRQKIEDQRY